MLVKGNVMAFITAKDSDNFQLMFTYVMIAAGITSSVSQQLVMSYAFHHFP